MGIDRDTLDQVVRLLRPLVARVANTVARGVVELVGDAGDGQTLQISVLDGEVIDDAEHVQPYGLSSVPHTGAECAVIFPGGDRGHPLVVSVADRRHRPSGAEPGTVTLYSSSGSRVTLLPSGDIEVQPGPGGEIRLGAAATNGAIRGTQRDYAEQTFLAAMDVFVTAVADITGAPSAAKAAFKSAIAAFKAAATAAVSSTVRLE